MDLTFQFHAVGEPIYYNTINTSPAKCNNSSNIVAIGKNVPYNKIIKSEDGRFIVMSGNDR